MGTGVNKTLRGWTLAQKHRHGPMTFGASTGDKFCTMTHRTMPLKIVISNAHIESMTFHLIDSPDTEGIGFPMAPQAHPPPWMVFWEDQEVGKGVQQVMFSSAEGIMYPFVFRDCCKKPKSCTTWVVRISRLLAGHQIYKCNKSTPGPSTPRGQFSHDLNQEKGHEGGGSDPNLIVSQSSRVFLCG